MRRILVLPVLPVLLILAGCGGGNRPEDSDVATFTVKSGNLKITLTESGQLQARRKVNLRPKIKTGAKILSIVDEGTEVKKGQVLVELDKTSVERDIEQFQDRVIQLEADLKNARTDLEIQKAENESQIEKAKLNLEFAKMELQRYLKGDLPQTRRDKQLRIDKAESRLKQAEEKYAKMPELEKEGFVTPLEVEEKKLALEEAQVELDSANLDLRLFKEYTQPMEEKQKRSDVTEAERELSRVKARADAKLEAKKAVALQKDRQYKAAVRKLEEAQAELENMTIRAPQDGIVIYAQARSRWGSSDDTVKVGETAFPGRTLIELPDLSRMDVRIQVHQADVNKLRKGQTAWITAPGRRARPMKAVVAEIGSVAQSTSWRDPVRRFEVILQIVDRVEGLRAGVTVECEIDVGEIRGVLYVPLQAVSSAGGSYSVFVKKGGEIQRRAVRLGRSNDQYVEVVDGLAEGDEVLLVNPEVVSEEKQKPAGSGKPSSSGKPAAPKGRSPGKAPRRPTGKERKPGGGRPGGR